MSQKPIENKANRGGEEGSTLIEILIAFLIFLILMLGVLQMFSLAFLLNKGAGARTEMTYKGQQVVENIRFLNRLYKDGQTLPSDVASWFPLTDGATHDLSNLTGLSTSFWGPSQADIVETATPRYALSLQVKDSGSYWLVTVTAKPNQAAGVAPYLGGVGKYKGIEYVAQLEK